MLIFESMGLTHTCCKPENFCDSWRRNRYLLRASYQHHEYKLEEALEMLEQCYQAYRGPMEMFPFNLLDFLLGDPSQGSQDNYGMVNWQQKDQSSGIEDAEELTEQEELTGEGGEVAEEVIDNEQNDCRGKERDSSLLVQSIYLRISYREA